MKSIQASFCGTSFHYLLGPTCVGKGFIYKLADRSLTESKKQGLRIEIISFGQIIRDLMKRNPAFHKAHASTVEKGDLLEDPTAIELFDGKLLELDQEGPFDMIFVDGFLRTGRQVTHAADLGLLRRQDRVFIFDATHDMCSRRFTHRNEKDPGRLEREMGTFTKRYHLHSDNIGSLKQSLSQTNVRENIIEINANNRDARGNNTIEGHPTMGITEYAAPALIDHMIPVVSNILAKRTAELQSQEVHDG